MIIAAGSVFAQPIPHPLYVEVQNESGYNPLAGDLTFEAWLTNDPTSVLTQSSFGCFYSVPPGVGVECGNFATAWTAGDVVHIEVEQTSTGDVGTGEFTLNNENVQMFSGGDGIIIAASFPSEVWVDDNYTAVSCGGHTWDYDAFDNISDGVTAVAEDGTVNVADGLYEEFITIDESLTLKGAFSGTSGYAPGRDGSNESIIIPPDDAVRQDPFGIMISLITNNAENVTIDGFTLQDEKDLSDEYAATIGIYSDQGNFNAKNNRVIGLPMYGICVHRSAGDVETLGTIVDVEISTNYITGTALSDLTGTWAYAISLLGTVGDVLSNVIDQSRCGIAVQPYNQSTVEITTDGLVSNNIFNTYTMGVFNHEGGVSGHYAVSGNWTFSNNEFNLTETLPAGIVTRTTYTAVYTRASWHFFGKSITYSNNTFDVSNAGTIGYVKENIEGFTYRNDIFHNFNQQHTAADINFVYTNNTFTSDDFDFYFDRSSGDTYPTYPPMEIDLADIKANNTFTDGSIICGDKLVAPSKVNVINTTQYLGYETIQAAIDAANSSDVITVAAGTYYEVGQIVIDKNLTIVGSGKATTIIKPDHDTTVASYDQSSAWIYVSPAVTFALSDVTLDGTDLVGEPRIILHAIQSRGELTVEDCIIKNIKAELYKGRGISLLTGTGNITRCEFSNIQRIGIHVRGGAIGTAPNPIAYIEDCTYIGKGDGDWLDYGIEFGGGGSGTVDGYDVSACTGVTSTNYVSAGIYATDFYGTGTSVTVVNSTVTGNRNGILVGYNEADTTVLIAHNNNISGNTYYGIYNHMVVEVDATLNYWGPNGPQSTVSDYVLYIPWYADEAMTTLVGNPVTNQTQNTGYATIQAAVDAANTGDVISVTAGTYAENLTIGTELTLIKNGSSLPVIEVDDGVAITVTADNVTINGFEINHTTVDGEGDIGVRLNENDNCYVKNCDINNNSIGIMLFNSSHNNMLNNEMDSNVIGIYFEGEGGVSTYNTVTNNTITNCPTFPGVDSGQAIYLDMDCDHNDFLDNTITDNGAIGIYFWKASNNTIINNTISGNPEEGIQLMGSSSNTITDNTVSSNGIGLQMRCGALSTTSNTIQNNLINSNTTGITLEDDVSGNSYVGVVTGNTIKYNEISGNTSYGISLSDTPAGQTYDATRNYWGEADGPNNTSNPLGGSGNAVSDNVDFMPWYATATTTPSTELATLKGNYGSKTIIEVFTSNELTNALASAALGDSIILGSGTFTGNFTVEDNITITAADGAVPTIIGDDEVEGPALTINTNGVSVSGVNIEADSGDEAVVVNVTDASSVSVTDGSIIADEGKGIVNNATSGTVDATSNYWGAVYTTGNVTGSVDTGDPILNDPVALSVSPASYLVTGGEEAQYDVNIGEVDALGAYEIEIVFSNSDFTNPGKSEFSLGELFVTGNTLFYVADETAPEEDHYTYLINCAVTNQTNVSVVGTGATGELLTFNLTSLPDHTNLIGSNISINVLNIEEFENGSYVTIPCNGVSNGVVTIDSEVPEIDGISEAENGYYATAPVISALGYYDNYDVATFWYQIDATAAGSWTEIPGTPSGDVPGRTWAAAADWTLPGFGDSESGLSEGSHIVYFQAIDQAGNTSTSSWQFNKDTTAPAALVWKVSGHNNYPETSVDSNNKIELQWDDPSESYSYIHIWRKAYSDFGINGANTGYPEYTGTAPTSPTLPADPKLATDVNDWTKVTKADITSFTNTLDTRGFYYYVIYAEGLNGLAVNPSVVSPALSYWLGDVNETPDGEVTSLDIALFSPAWNTTASGSILDVGPTSDYSRNALPTPDGAIGFEDLMIFAMNYENTDYSVYTKDEIPASHPIYIDLVTSTVGDQLIAELILDDNDGFVRGLHIPVNYGNGLVLTSVTSGDIWNSTDFFIYSNKDNCLEVDGSALGELGIVENNGTIATLTFDIVGDNMDLLPGVAIARSVDNEEIECTGFALDADDEPIPTVYNLYQNYPNPFNKSTKIMFALPQAGKVKITVYNIRGQLVDELTNEDFNAGNHVVEWNNPDLKPGMYFYRIKTDNYTKVKKCLLIR